MLTDAEILSYICSNPTPSKRALLAGATSKTAETSLFYSGIEGSQSFEHPAANILQKNDVLSSPMTLYLSYPPSEIELGMVWRASKIKNIYFAKSLNPLVVGQYKITSDGCEIIDPCGLNAKIITDEEKKKLESSEPRLKIAMDNPIDKREMSPFLFENLKRGLAEAGSNPIVDNRTERKINEDFMRVVLSMVDRAWNSKDKTIKPLDRVAGANIGAIMVDANNRIIGWGLNYKGNNHTLHAETMMIQRYLRENNLKKLPDGIKIYTSLQCCHMCAGHIAELGRNVKVFYAQNDTFQNPSALKRNVNGCSEEPTTLPIKDVIASRIGKQLVLDFLFEENPNPNLVPGKTYSKLQTREFFTRTYRDLDLFSELASVAQARIAKMKPPAAVNEQQPTEPEIARETPSESPIIKEGRRFLDGLGNIAPSNTERLKYNKSNSIFQSTDSDKESDECHKNPARSPR